MKAASGDSNPLLIPTREAKAKLESWYQAGHDLHDKVEKAYNANHTEAPIDVAVIRKFLKNIEDWFDRVSSDLKGIYLNEDYVKRFLANPFNKKWFALTQAILKDNLVQLYKTGNYRNRLSMAGPAEIKQIMREIMNDIGSIEPHWNAEKDRMINNINERLKEGLDYLLDRIAFIGAFGEVPGLIQIELDLADTQSIILNAITKDPFIMAEISDDNYFSRLFEEMEKSKSFGLDTHIEAKIDTLRNPTHKKFEIEKKQLLEIFYDGTGRMVDSLSVGGPYWLNIFNERADSIIEAKRRFNQSFQRTFNPTPSDFIAEWADSPPKYDLNHSRYSFEELGKYGFEQLYILSSLPNIIIESHLSKQGDKPPRTIAKAAFAVRKETKAKYEKINRTFNRLKKDNPQYSNKAIFRLVAEELLTTESTVKRAIYG
jgi:hypothetical protein